MTDLIKQVKKALRAKGYTLPTKPFKTDSARAMFIAKHGYDPAILINTTIRMADGSGPGWEERITPHEPRKPQGGKRETKAVWPGKGEVKRQRVG